VGLTTLGRDNKMQTDEMELATHHVR